MTALLGVGGVLALSAALVLIVSGTAEARPGRELGLFVAWSLAGSVALPAFLLAAEFTWGSALITALLSPVVYGLVRLNFALGLDDYSQARERVLEKERLKFHQTSFGEIEPTTAQKRRAATSPSRPATLEAGPVVHAGAGSMLAELTANPQTPWQRRAEMAFIVGASLIGAALFGAYLAYRSGVFDPSDADLESIAIIVEERGFAVPVIEHVARGDCPEYESRSYRWSASGARGRACVKRGLVWLWVDQTWPRDFGADAATSPAKGLASTVISDH